MNGKAHKPSFSFPGNLPAPVLNHHGKTLFTSLQEWTQKNQIPPVILFTGQPGIGKRSIAYFLTQWIFCERTRNPFTPSPCQECPSCQKLLSGNSVDLIEIAPEPHEESLKIDQFRKLKDSLGFGAHESGYRIILIPNVERMTPQAANSMLKILEEPPSGWIFLMTTHDPALLLPTLVSRCQTLRLKPFLTSEIEKILTDSGIEKDKAKVCAELSQGSWGRALFFAENEIWEKRETILRFLEDPASVLQTLVDWASQETRYFEALVDLLEQFTANQIRSSLTSGKSTGFLFAQTKRLAESRQKALTPVNRKILIQDLLMPWMENHL